MNFSCRPHDKSPCHGPKHSQAYLHLLAFVGIVLATVFVSLPLRAEAGGSRSSDEASLRAMPKILRQCRTAASCDPRALTVRVLAKRDEVGAEVRPLLPRLLLIAGIQAEIWDDTILEGPYEAENFIALDQVEGFFHNDQLVAYRITYSARAWRLGRGGVRVEEGRIVESAFVSVSLKGFFRDERAIAEFHPLR